jgi:hypothetical protein
MNAPTAHVIWQAFAQDAARVSDVFAMAGAARHCFKVGQGEHSCSRRNYSNTPTPSLRSGPSQAGPFPFAGRGADCVRGVKFCFEIADIAVESAAITTNHRGSHPCASRLSFSHFSLRRWPVACRTPRRAGLRVPLRAPSLPMPPRVTCLPVPSSAALQALRPAASNLACRPVTRATDLAAFGRFLPTARTIRANRPGGPLLLRV